MSAVTLPRTPSFRLDGKVAIVTGASRGIGLGCAVAVAELGAKVICMARGEQQLLAAVKAMQEAGLNADAEVFDVSDTGGFDSYVDALPRLDVYVNSAGIARHGPAMETQEGPFDEVVNTNLKAAYFSSRAAARKMMERDGTGDAGGSVINISSQMAHIGGIERSVYCATKHGVEGFTKAMAIEWGKQSIRINTICPTFIRTELTASTFENPERVAWIEDKIKLGRVGEVEDIMGAVQYLASDASALVTGTSLLVDGGWTAE